MKNACTVLSLNLHLFATLINFWYYDNQALFLTTIYLLFFVFLFFAYFRPHTPENGFDI